MPTPTNRLRPTLETLEAREVCWAGLPGLPLGGLSPIVHLGPATPPAPADRPAPRLHVADATFTLVNGTSHAVTFAVRWQGATRAESYTLLPGESRTVWVQEVERFSVQTATVQVGRQVFRVKAGLTADGPTGPVGSGPVYTFQPGPSGGVVLRSANRV